MNQVMALSTYKAVLRGNHLEWRGDVSKHIAPGQAVAVYVTILDEPVEMTAPNEGQGQRMAAALQQLADIHACADIVDPVVWEREARRERVLPDREA
jgi:hypothetical protein